MPGIVGVDARGDQKCDARVGDSGNDNDGDAEFCRRSNGEQNYRCSPRQHEIIPQNIIFVASFVKKGKGITADVAKSARMIASDITRFPDY